MPAKLDKCVADVKKQGDGVDNPWAVCTASINEDNHSIEETITKQIVEATLNRGCGCQKKKT